MNATNRFLWDFLLILAIAGLIYAGTRFFAGASLWKWLRSRAPLTRVGLFVGAILIADMLVPGVKSGELGLQAGLVAFFGAVSYLRR